MLGQDVAVRGERRKFDTESSPLFVQDKLYVMAGTSKEEYPEIPENHIVRLNLKPYNAVLANPRHFFSDWSAD